MSMRATSTTQLRRTIEAIRSQVVGRERELELMLTAVSTQRDLLVEGPPGTSKTTLLRAITSAWDIPLVFVEGNAELTPGRLLGHHDPARVLQEGFSAETFVDGPLVQAMRQGAFLYFEEINRAPEDALNALLNAIADRQVTIPRVGTIQALPTFRVVGSMNPYDNVGTTRLSISIRDRFCRMSVGYQDEAAEREIVALRCDADPDDALDLRVLHDAVAVTRMTRVHEFVRQGSSVRGAIDLQVTARQLCRIRDIAEADDPRYPHAFLEAMMLALSGRLLVDEATGVDAVSVLHEIWESRFVLDAAMAEPG
jgi:MoxR-like ATPase